MASMTTGSRSHKRLGEGSPLGNVSARTLNAEGRNPHGLLIRRGHLSILSVVFPSPVLIGVMVSGPGEHFSLT